MFTSILAGGGRRAGMRLPSLLLTLGLQVPVCTVAAAEHPVRPERADREHYHPVPADAANRERHAIPIDRDEHTVTDRLSVEGPGDARATDHPEEEHAHGHGESIAVRLSPQQREAVDIAILELEPLALDETLHAPGEVRLNAYGTAQVTPRVEAQVVARHARLGDHVAQGQPLVTLSSVDMAEAQGDLVVAELEWRRLSKLKRQFVSESDYLQASVARQKALSRVLAYGMTQSQAKALAGAESEKADGTFELLAPQSGTVVRDAFVLGELVEPGRVLFEITDESVRWVEARLPPQEASRVSIGQKARITYRETWLQGRVTQIHHLLDETTRTQAVRVEVPDPAHRLHPGVFVDVSITTGSGEPVLTLPEEAVLRSPEGGWRVFVAEGEGLFRPVEVELLYTTGGMAALAGLPPGTPVVTHGTFFLQSELAKSGFDPHHH